MNQQIQITILNGHIDDKINLTSLLYKYLIKSANVKLIDLENSWDNIYREEIYSHISKSELKDSISNLSITIQ